MLTQDHEGEMYHQKFRDLSELLIQFSFSRNEIGNLKIKLM